MSDEDVKEVLEFAQSGPLFAGSTQSTGARLLTSFEGAYSRATSQSEPGSPWANDWTELREQQAAKLVGLRSGLEPEERRLVRQRCNVLAATLSDILFPRLDALGFAQAHNEVSVDLEKVATSRLLQGTRDPFWEQVFALYRAGLWPCGWDGGEYPNGSFVAFNVPSKR